MRSSRSCASLDVSVLWCLLAGWGGGACTRAAPYWRKLPTLRVVQVAPSVEAWRTADAESGDHTRALRRGGVGSFMACAHAKAPQAPPVDQAPPGCQPPRCRPPQPAMGSWAAHCSALTTTAPATRPQPSCSMGLTASLTESSPGNHLTTPTSFTAPMSTVAHSRQGPDCTPSSVSVNAAADCAWTATMPSHEPSPCTQL